MTPFYSYSKTLNSDWHMALGPSAIYVSALDRTICVWQTVGHAGNKNVLVAAYDHTLDSWSGPFVAGNFALSNDDHGQPAICRDPDGYFHVFYGSHASAQHHSISTVPDAIEAWTPQTSISGAQTYPRPVLVGSTMYLFLRNDTTTTRCLLSVRTATPSGGNASFGSFINLVDFGANSRAYRGEAYAVGTDIHLICTRSDGPNTYRKDVYYFVYDTLTGAVRNHDASVSTASGSLPISLSTANSSYRLFDHGTGQGEVPSFCFDSNGDPHVIFADNGGSGTTYTLKHIKRTSGVWSNPVTVDTIFDILDGSGFTTIYGIVPTASGAIEAWYMDASGGRVRKIRDNSGTWSSAETILSASAGRKLMGMQAVLNAHPDLRVVFSEVSPSSLDAEAIPSKRYAHGDSGFLPAIISLADGDPLFDKVSLLFGFEQRDGSTKLINEAFAAIAPTSVVGNLQVDTAQSKYGAASLLADSSGDYAAFAHDPLFSVSNGDFCFECYVRRNGSKLQCIASKRPSSGSSEWAFYIDATNRLRALAFNANTAVVDAFGATVLASGAQYLARVARQGAIWRVFLDGVLDASSTELAAPVGNTQPLHIGRDPGNTTRDFDGHIDELRFTSGVSRETASFTPPTTKFPRGPRVTLSSVVKSFNAKRALDSSFVFVDGLGARQDLTAEASTEALADQAIEAQIVTLRNAASGAALDELNEVLALAQS